MICNSNSHHDKNCPNYKKDNRLKGASAVNNSPKIYTFNLNEIQLLTKVLELSRYYVKDLQNQGLLLKVNNEISNRLVFSIQYLPFRIFA
jgi:hypothetical protein